MRNAHLARILSQSFAALTLLLLAARPALSQQFPIPQLATLSPTGGKAGAEVEVTLDGKYLDDASVLLFSNATITAKRLAEPPPKDPKKPTPPGPPRFAVTIPAGTPPGSFDVRVAGKWGISNPRLFVVSTANEVAEKEPNSDVPQAQPVALGDVVNGAINPKVDVDYYQFPGRKGQRIVIHCAGSSIDSRLNPALELYSSAGRLLASNKQYRHREALLDCVLPADGDYLARVFEFTYVGGGPEYFYRLSLGTGPWLDAAYPPVVEAGKSNTITLFGRNLPQGKSGPMTRGARLQTATVTVTPPAPSPGNFLGIRLPRAASIDGFEYQVQDGNARSNTLLLTYADAPIVLDNESNDSPETAQDVAAPCCLCGRIEKRGDRDWYAFAAKKDDVFILEGYADRLGAPVDLYFVLRRADNEQRLGEYDVHNDIPATVGSLFTLSDDPQTRFVAPADGVYQLLVSCRTADVLGGPRRIYRLSIRREQPDFRLLIVANNDQSTGGCTLRRGAHQDMEIVCFRRDGFDGEVELIAEGLPSGVTCPPQIIGPKARSTNLVFSAATNAADWVGQIKIKGVAHLDGQKVVREARAACLVWPPPNNAPAISRLAQSLYLAVRDRDQFPFTLAVKEKELVVPIGGSASVNVQLQKFSNDLTGNVQVQRLSGPVQTNGAAINFPNTNIAVNKPGAEIKFTIPGNSQPGTFNLVLRGQGQFKYTPDPKVKKTQNLQVQAIAPPVKVTLYNQVAELSVDKPNLTLTPGQQMEIRVRVKRLHDYKGEFKVQLLLPPGVSGVTAAEAVIPPNASEAKLIIKANKDAKGKPVPNVIIRATGRVGNISMVHEEKITLGVATAGGSRPAIRAAAAAPAMVLRAQR